MLVLSTILSTAPNAGIWLISAEIMLLIYVVVIFGIMIKLAGSNFLLIAVLALVMILLFVQVWHSGGGLTGLFNPVPGWILSPGGVLGS